MPSFGSICCPALPLPFSYLQDSIILIIFVLLNFQTTEAATRALKQNCITESNISPSGIHWMLIFKLHNSPKWPVLALWTYVLRHLTQCKGISKIRWLIIKKTFNMQEIKKPFFYRGQNNFISVYLFILHCLMHIVFISFYINEVATTNVRAASKVCVHH